MVDVVGDELLLVETALVDGIFGEVGFDYLEVALMAAAVAFVAEAVVVVVGEVYS